MCIRDRYPGSFLDADDYLGAAWLLSREQEKFRGTQRSARAKQLRSDVDTIYDALRAGGDQELMLVALRAGFNFASLRGEIADESRSSSGLRRSEYFAARLEAMHPASGKVSRAALLLVLTKWGKIKTAAGLRKWERTNILRNRS